MQYDSVFYGIKNILIPTVNYDEILRISERLSLDSSKIKWDKSDWSKQLFRDEYEKVLNTLSTSDYESLVADRVRETESIIIDSSKFRELNEGDRIKLSGEEYSIRKKVYSIDNNIINYYINFIIEEKAEDYNEEYISSTNKAIDMLKDLAESYKDEYDKIINSKPPVKIKKKWWKML